MYKKLPHGGIQRGDGAYIPEDMGNRDYVEYLDWVAKGNAPTPAYALAEYKALRVSNINAECETRIFARWSLPKQISCDAGLYGTAAKADCDAWRAGHINAADMAQAAINAVPDTGNLDADIAAVDAVMVNWPA